MTPRRTSGLRKKKRRKSGEITLLKKKLWQLCKEIVRKCSIIDSGALRCYTCPKGPLEPKNAHTGHFIASSLCSTEMRYNLANLAIQCYNCNINKSGNTLQFRLNLIRDHGAEFVDELWSRNEATKGQIFPTSWFKDKILQYTKILESIKVDNSHVQQK